MTLLAAGLECRYGGDPALCAQRTAQGALAVATVGLSTAFRQLDIETAGLGALNLLSGFIDDCFNRINPDNDNPVVGPETGGAW